MIFIGEKLNGAIPAVGRAIAARDETFIRDLAKRQAQAGAAFIDVCAACDEGELDALRWLIERVQEVTDTPLSIDSPNAACCVKAMNYCARPGIVNSVSGEEEKLTVILPALAGSGWGVTAMLSDDRGIPQTAAERVAVLDRILDRAGAYGIESGRVYADPLVEMLCGLENGAKTVLETVAAIRESHPDVHISGGLSNISYNLPCRKILNQAFAVLCAWAGMDCMVLDPLNRDLLGAVYAAEALRGDDEFCMAYIGAYRRGVFGA